MSIAFKRCTAARGGGSRDLRDPIIKKEGKKEKDQTSRISVSREERRGRRAQAARAGASRRAPVSGIIRSG
ncbi:hypothetical protein EVAR_31540_1 [Eumeta japonica]|uniref:Uncharacterized protein n=1 Tax=Eumeta variegata TaxID=151549 RepID=A0A4C1V767_EUMVA|nr:hypothetical protein EVAR_31540_1 [Eumeta japonica]